MKTFVTLPAAILAVGFVTLPVMAQETTSESAAQAPVVAKEVPPPEGSAEQAAQHLREHQRAVAAGDHANDPLNPTSSNFLNRRELDRIRSLGSGLSYVYPETTMPRNTPVEGLPPEVDDGSVESLPPDSPPPPETDPTGQVPPIPQPVTPEDDPLSPNSGIR